MILPLWGAASLHQPPPLWTEFPPLTRTLSPAPFSEPLFFLFTVLFVLALLLLVRPRWFGFAPMWSEAEAGAEAAQPAARFPWWGWLGLGLIAVFWTIAWTRFVRMPLAIQMHTFFPLWLGYILTMDALAYRRAGTSLLHESPRRFAWLFPASAVAWWYFEFVNRSVQNWWYLGVESYTATHYMLMATISFATVFPAIFTTQRWLLTYRWFRSAYAAGPRWPQWGRGAAWAVFGAGLGLLALTGFYPVSLFFLTWLAPLLIVAAGLTLAGVATPFHALRQGDYTQLFSLAVAALMCGVFWELWNVASIPKWEYSVPYVQALLVFEMPLPGYAGYLPFGPVCWCMWRAMNVLAGRETAV
jgi:hypothetical protein